MGQELMLQKMSLGQEVIYMEKYLLTMCKKYINSKYIKDVDIKVNLFYFLF